MQRGLKRCSADRYSSTRYHPQRTSRGKTCSKIVDELCERLISGVNSRLDKRAFQAGVPAFKEITYLIMKGLEDADVCALLCTIENAVSRHLQVGHVPI